jgi:Cytochrome c3
MTHHRPSDIGQEFPSVSVAQTQPTTPSPANRDGSYLWALGPAFLLAGAWLMFGPSRASVPSVSREPVARERIAPFVRRELVGEPPTLTVGGFAHSCSDCHRLFDPPKVEHAPLMQHTHIVFNHGLNDRCFNCHDRENRDRLAMRDGTLLTFEQVPTLCSQCHGTVYRDWLAGTHGKTTGSWDASTGLQRRLTCNECHDPHSPAYKPMAPLPGPNTLRMGDQAHHEEPPDRHRPLRRWPRPAPAGAEHPAPEEKHP